MSDLINTRRFQLKSGLPSLEAIADDYLDPLLRGRTPGKIILAVHIDPDKITSADVLGIRHQEAYPFINGGQGLARIASGVHLADLADSKAWLNRAS